MVERSDLQPEIAPSQRYGVLEIDTFCTGCRYNLHGQVVSIDPRLGLLICRCPECGKYHPAGTGVTAAGIWTRRFATILLFVWICTVVVGLTGMAFMMGGFDASSVGMYAYNDSGPLVIKGRPVYCQALHPWYGDDPESRSNLNSMVLLSAGSLIAGFVTTVFCVSLLWHWPRWRYYWIFALAILPAILVDTIFLLNDEYMLIRQECAEHIASQAAFQCIGIVMGIFLGRPLARQLVRMIVPPKPRQALAFLWQVDGKQFPSDSQSTGFLDAETQFHKS